MSMGATKTDETVEAIADLALQARLSVAVAESLTSGILSSELGKGPDAAEWLKGGVVAYTPQVKQAVLDVTPGPVVTGRCAEEMAEGVARLFGADAAVATTGVGGPDPAEGKEPGTVFLGWWHDGRSGSREHHFDGDPAHVLRLTVDAGLDMLLAVLNDTA